MDQTIKKRDTVLAVKQVIEIPKFNVLDHETISWFEMQESNLDWKAPKGTTDIIVIYLGK